MLAAYAILVPTSYGNRETRLHGFRFGKIAWLAESFTCLDSIQLEV